MSKLFTNLSTFSVNAALAGGGMFPFIFAYLLLDAASLIAKQARKLCRTDRSLRSGSELSYIPQRLVLPSRNGRSAALGTKRTGYVANKLNGTVYILKRNGVKTPAIRRAGAQQTLASMNASQVRRAARQIGRSADGWGRRLQPSEPAICHETRRVRLLQTNRLTPDRRGRIPGSRASHRRHARASMCGYRE
jgi:hypothetical protein